MLHLDRAFHLRREHSDPPIACSTFEGYKPRREGVGLPTHNFPVSDGSHRILANDRPNESVPLSWVLPVLLTQGCVSLVHRPRWQIANLLGFLLFPTPAGSPTVECALSPATRDFSANPCRTLGATLGPTRRTVAHSSLASSNFRNLYVGSK